MLLRVVLLRGMDPSRRSFLAGSLVATATQTVTPFIFRRASWNARKALQEGGHIEVPAGRHIIKGRFTPINVDRRGLSIEGAGSRVSELIFEQGGLRINSPEVSWTSHIKGVSLKTQKSGAGPAVRVSYPHVDSSIWTACKIDDVLVSGADIRNDRWTGGVDLVNCWNSTINDLQIQGTPGSGLSTRMIYGVRIRGQSTAPTLKFSKIHNARFGLIIQDETEGARVHDVDFVGGRIAVDASSRGHKFNQAPMLYVEDCHTNTTVAAVRIRDRAQTWVKNSLIYRLGGSPDWVAVDALRCADTTIAGNKIFGINPRGTGAAVRAVDSRSTEALFNKFDGLSSRSLIGAVANQGNTVS